MASPLVVTGLEVDWAAGVELFVVSFGRGKTVSLFGLNVQENRVIGILDALKEGDQLVEVVPIG